MLEILLGTLALIIILRSTGTTRGTGGADSHQELALGTPLMAVRDGHGNMEEFLWEVKAWLDNEMKEKYRSSKPFDRAGRPLAWPRRTSAGGYPSWSPSACSEGTVAGARPTPSIHHICQNQSL
jgi:hypothetical protein